jgi:hypothetical protein
MESAPFGKEVSSMLFASSSVESGVADAGFTMMGQPAAMAGAILWAARFIGKSKGEMPATRPTGKYFTSPSPVLAAGSPVKAYVFSGKHFRFFSRDEKSLVRAVNFGACIYQRFF